MVKSMLLVLVAVLGLLAAFVPSAFATCGTGSQNPDLTGVFCISPNIIHVGGTFTLHGSMTNNTTSSLVVTAKVVLKAPDGTTATLISQIFTLSPGQSVPYNNNYGFTPNAPLGKYVITGSLKDFKGRGTSHASAHATLEP
jgi:hypothetical protein